jgi:diguanylate cyclase (GGDEF)-like protein
MPSDKDHRIAAELADLLLDVLLRPEPPSLPEQYADVESLQTLHSYLRELRDSLFAASNGDLSGRVPLKGYVGGTLKTLQANLRHMTWQTKMVASGDFSQRVEFMGEFSESFNAMVLQLDQTLQELMAKKTALGLANEELRKENTIRKETETALRKSQDELQRLAMTDALTGLFNRRHFNRVAEEEISRTLRYKHPLSVMVFDIDFFKRVNDNFGHSTGDRVLAMIARITREVLRSSEIPARWGGEEFIVLLPETPAAAAAAVAERLRGKIEEAELTTERGPVKVTASFGVSDVLERSDTRIEDQIVSEFVSTADRAMYASKSTGRNRVTVFKADQSSGKENLHSNGGSPPD